MQMPSHGRGRRFEPCTAHQIKQNVRRYHERLYFSLCNFWRKSAKSRVHSLSLGWSPTPKAGTVFALVYTLATSRDDGSTGGIGVSM